MRGKQAREPKIIHHLPVLLNAGYQLSFRLSNSRYFPIMTVLMLPPSPPPRSTDSRKAIRNANPIRRNVRYYDHFNRKSHADSSPSTKGAEMEMKACHPRDIRGANHTHRSYSFHPCLTRSAILTIFTCFPGT